MYGDDREWLNALKEGDRVVVSARDVLMPGTVKRVTPKRQIVVTYRSGGQDFEERFNRHGFSNASDSWHGKTLIEPTLETMEKAQIQRLEQTARGVLSRVAVPKGDVARLEEFIRALRPFVPKQEG